jgi:hypothetical protein
MTQRARTDIGFFPGPEDKYFRTDIPIPNGRSRKRLDVESTAIAPEEDPMKVKASLLRLFASRISLGQ